MLTTAMRRLFWRRRVRAAHAWRDDQRAAYQQAVGRLAALAPTVPDPAGQPR